VTSSAGRSSGYIDGGFGLLLDALVDAVGRDRIETGTAVTGLSRTEAERADTSPIDSVTTRTETGDTEVHDVDRVVVATMPDVLESLTGYGCEIDFQGSVCALATMTEPLLDTYWLNIADDAPFGALVEHTNFVPPEHYGGQHLLYVASYVQGPTDDLWELDDEDVESLWLDGIRSLFPDFDPGVVTEFRVARNPKTAPVYERGYLDMVVPYDLAEAGHPGVYYAGMASRAQYPERSLNGAIEAGYAAADRIIGRER